MNASRNHPINCGLATTATFASVFAKRTTPGFVPTFTQVPRIASQASQSNVTVQDRTVVRSTSASGVYDILATVSSLASINESFFTITSDNTGILSNAVNGVLTHAGNGDVMVSTTSLAGEVVRSQITSSSFTSQNVDVFSAWSSGTAGKAFTDAVENALPSSPESPVYGSNFVDGVLNMLDPPGPYATSGWQRNSNFWLASVDWSCLSIRNSGGHARGGVLVSPRYAICAAHYPFSAGETLTFLTHDNVSRVRTVHSVTNFPAFSSYDTCLVRLSEPLTFADHGIKFCKVFPSTYANYFPGTILSGVSDSSKRGLPALVTNQDKLMGAARCFLPSTTTRTFLTSNGALLPNGTFTQFYNNNIGVRFLDSGHPAFCLVGSDPVLLGTWTSISTGSNFTGNTGFRTAINAVMAADSESLTDISLSGFTNYA